MRTSMLTNVVAILTVVALGVKANETAPSLIPALPSSLQEVQVWGEAGSRSDTGVTTPTSRLFPDDLQGVNAVTTEDLIKHEPSLIVRRRFIGDANGTLGMRGSNMFQTARMLVFADGMPLHYLLESRWNGAPRWGLVSASEIEQVDLLYGPFSAEYGGNAMGGVVRIETGIPQEPEFRLESSAFVQQFRAYGFDGSLQGHKGFIAYGDQWGNLSYYLSINHLENEGQPQTFRSAEPRPVDQAGSVTGAIQGLDAQGRGRLWYGDTGVVHQKADNYKLKLAYAGDAWQSLFNAVYEDRNAETTANSYVSDLDGNRLWSGDTLVQDGLAFSIDPTRLNESLDERESLSLAWRVKGRLAENVSLQAKVSQFDILEDQSRSSNAHPHAPHDSPAGQVTAYGDTGWQTAGLKLTFEGRKGLELITGLQHENYELNLNVFDSPDYRSGELGQYSSRFGGKTKMHALFGQLNWTLSERWDTALGLRHEVYQSRNGYYTESTTSGLQRIGVPKTKEIRTSPKFSLGYRPENDWLIRYSVARAYRFPIAEELFRQYQAYNQINQANPDLNAEEGLHHNLMVQRNLSGGYLRLNLFQETIQNAIESQSTTIVGGANDGVSLSTFIPLDETRAHGIEFIANQEGFVFSALDLRFNVSYTTAIIEQNHHHNEWEGNHYPRIPKWRTKLLADYHFSDRWNAGLSLRYASDSYGRLANDDRTDQVYGAQDAYTRIGLKTHFSLSDTLTASVGVDNVTNDIRYVAHPWPGRTYYLNLAYEL